MNLFGEPDAPPAPRVKHPARGYVQPPGTGPAGETCRTCRHAVLSHGGQRSFWKCDLARPHWTCSYGSDIRLKSPACRSWAPVTPKKP